MKATDLIVGMTVSKQHLLEMGFCHLKDYPIGAAYTNGHIWVVWNPNSRKIISIHNGGY
jgi:hypothetical protein